MSTQELIRSPGVPAVLVLYGHIMLLGFAYTAGQLTPSSYTAYTITHHQLTY